MKGFQVSGIANKCSEFTWAWKELKNGNIVRRLQEGMMTSWGQDVARREHGGIPSGYTESENPNL